MILDEIVETKQTELPQEGSFKAVFTSSQPVIITEIKLKSPTHPEPFADDYREIIDDYKTAGIEVISVVTDKQYFGGDVSIVREARKAGFKVLRKDFIIQPSQIAEVYADAILLIARIVTPERLKQLVDICFTVGIEPVVEINSESELGAVYDTKAGIIAVNSRDLDKQLIDFEAGLGLLGKIDPKYTKPLFSGISHHSQIEQAISAGANGVLIGTSVLSAEDRVAKIGEFTDD